MPYKRMRVCLGGAPPAAPLPKGVMVLNVISPVQQNPSELLRGAAMLKIHIDAAPRRETRTCCMALGLSGCAAAATGPPRVGPKVRRFMPGGCPPTTSGRRLCQNKDVSKLEEPEQSKSRKPFSAERDILRAQKLLPCCRRLSDSAAVHDHAATDVSTGHSPGAPSQGRH
jgi:hypothetical protein